MSERKRGGAASIDIDALLQDTWLQVISLRHGPIFQDGEGRTLWERCIADVERVQRELKASELDEASCQHILTAQCALLDEAVKGRGVEDDACVQWYNIPLQGLFLGTMDAGDTLCDRMDAGSQLLVALRTDNEQEAQGWKPDGLLYQDFLVMLRVYLGWRFKARITLTTRTRLLAVPPLGEEPFWLGMNGVLGAEEGAFADDLPLTFTTELGYYTGLAPAKPQQGNRRAKYKFD